MRTPIVVIGLVACFFGFWVCERAGRTRSMINYRKDASLLASTDEAVRLSPSDPETHYARAMVLWRMQRFPEAIKEYENVLALRPLDYVPWLDLGSARDRNGDQDGALTAFKEAVRLAPYYGQPRWELGGLLLKTGHRDEAFVELRRAAMSDPTLLRGVIDLAWETYRGDARAVQQALIPETTQARLTLAHFFVEHGYATEATELFRSTSDATQEDRRALLTALLADRRFTEAYEVWTVGRESGGKEIRSGIGSITDGSFERDISLDDPGFGWQLASNLKAVRLSLDTNEPHTGTYSLRLDWSGDSNPSTPVVSQLVLVEPKTRYRLSFAVRTKEMLTIGLPMVTVADGGGDDGPVLAQSKAFPRGTSGWQDYTMEFTTAETTSGVRINILREDCKMVPCPILGQAWVDDFSLERL